MTLSHISLNFYRLQRLRTFSTHDAQSLSLLTSQYFELQAFAWVEQTKQEPRNKQTKQFKNYPLHEGCYFIVFVVPQTVRPPRMG